MNSRFARLNPPADYRVSVGTLYSQPPRVRNVRQFPLSLAGLAFSGMSLDIPSKFDNGRSLAQMFTPSKRYQRLYHRYNDIYFNGELPSDTQVGWMDYPKPTPVAETATADGCGVIHHTIYLSHYMKPFKTFPKFCLLHEMCHVKLHPYSEHDRKRFDAEMLRLAQAGAFHKIW